MKKFEEKIKSLLSDDKIEQLVAPSNEHDDEQCRRVSIDLAKEWRDTIAKLYAENYRVTWEQFVEHCKQEYSYTIEFRRSADLEYILLHNDGVRFYEGGTVRINALYPIAAKTLILWGRYLEGLEDE